MRLTWFGFFETLRVEPAGVIVSGFALHRSLELQLHLNDTLEIHGTG